jgi:hypothetical protein
MKRFVAYIFLFIFSLQMLPVKEIGEILFKGQITEEETHTCSNNCEDNGGLKLKKCNDFFELFLSEDQNESRTAFYNHNLLVAIAAADRLPCGFIPDIATPPPNC